MELNLHQRTIVILGPIKGTMQNLVMALAQHGADVGIIDPNGAQLERFCKTVSDQREIHDRYGRAMAVQADLTNWTSIKDAMGKIAQSFGSIDMLIDGMMTNAAAPFVVSGDDSVIDPIVHQNLTLSLKAAQFAAGFMKGRKRGRIIFMLNDSCNKGVIEDATLAAARTGLIAFSKTLARQLQEFNVTINCLSLGLSEEYLLGHFPDSNSLKEAQEKLKATDPTLKITDSEKVANSIVYLASNAGAAVTGQHLVLS